MMNRIPIIIPYYKAEEKLQKCLDALVAQSYKPIEIFVRDNSEDNILFTAAVNEGLNKYAFQSGINYILILNQDAYVQEQTIAELVNCMEENPACGICCPIQHGEDNYSVYWGGSYAAFPFGCHQCDPLNSYTSNFETYWANGAAMLVRVAMIREIGLMDKNMRFICSDSDYSFTARARGWKVMVAHKAKIYHSAGASGINANNFINKIKIQDALYFAKKWLTADIYKSIAFERDQLNEAYINQVIYNLEQDFKSLS